MTLDEMGEALRGLRHTLDVSELRALGLYGANPWGSGSFRAAWGKYWALYREIEEKLHFDDLAVDMADTSDFAIICRLSPALRRLRCEE